MAHTNEQECAGYLMLRDERYWEGESLHRAACHGEATWEIDGKHYCLMHAPTKDKAEKFERVRQERLIAENYNFSGVWFPGDVSFSKYDFKSDVRFDYAIFNGTVNFSFTQFSGGSADFARAQFSGGSANFVRAQFSGGYANFARAQFSDGNASFFGAQFSGGNADFSFTQFSGGHAYFVGAQFSGGNADFTEAQFSGGRADFAGAKFSGGIAGFRAALFNGRAIFRGAIFEKNFALAGIEFSKDLLFDAAEFKGNASFEKLKFSGDAFASFRRATFAGRVRFQQCEIKDKAKMYFGNSIFDKPESVNFHTMNELEPFWFMNVDTRKFHFEATEHKWLKGYGPAGRQLALAQSLLDKIKDQDFDAVAPSANKLLAISCRRLAENAEQNNRYDEAMNLRYMAMESHRRSKRRRRYLPTLTWLYWASSGYGERALRAGVLLAFVWLAPFVFYVSPLSLFHRPVREGDKVLNYVARDAAGKFPEKADMPALSPYRDDNLRDAAFHSLQVMAFQKPEPKPADSSTLTRIVVILQTILGPVQAALLLLAIRRKFMR